MKAWLALAISLVPALAAVRLTPETERAFDRYVESTEQRLHRELNPEHFLWLDSHTPERDRVHRGEVVMLSRKAADIRIPNGLVQDWYGAIFIPGATIQQARVVMQDYPNYQKFYQPEVTESKLLGHAGDDFDVFLRLLKKHILTVVLNTTYRVHYGELDPRRMYIESRSARIEEEPTGNDNGFLWRLNSYWRFAQADDGVYAECEAVSLSRDIPFGLGWMLKTFVERFPKESMLNTLNGTKKAVGARGRS